MSQTAVENQLPKIPIGNNEDALLLPSNGQYILICEANGKLTPMVGNGLVPPASFMQGGSAAPAGGELWG